MNPIPKAVWVLALPMLVIELALTMADLGMLAGPQGISWRLSVIQDYSVWPALWHEETGAGAYPFSLLLRFVSYSFVHVGLQHMIFAGVILLAVGKFVGDRFSDLAVLTIFLVSAVIGGLIYVLQGASEAVLIGAYPGVYGLIGALTFIYWEDERHLPLTMRMKAFRLIGLLVGVQLLFGLVLGGGLIGLFSEVPAFVAGFGLSTLLRPGGGRHNLSRLRRR